MGNSNGKPVVFTDEGQHPAFTNLSFRRHCRAPSLLSPQPHARASKLARMLTRPSLNSQPQPFPTSARGGQRCIWKGPHRRAKGHRLDLCPQVHSQRRRSAYVTWDHAVIDDQGLHGVQWYDRRAYGTSSENGECWNTSIMPSCATCATAFRTLNICEPTSPHIPQ